MSQLTAGYLYDRNLKSIKAAATVSATANSSGVDVTQFKGNGLSLIFNCSAVAGSGSLAIAVEESHDDSTYAAVSGATITVNAAGLSILFVPNFSRKYLRLAQTLTGTSVTYSCIAFGNPGESTTSAGYTVSPQS